MGVSCPWRVSVRAALASIVCLAGSGGAVAQEAARASLFYPSGERESSVIQLERVAPEQLKMGQANRYAIRVTNLSDATLGQVVVTETLGQGVQFESSIPEPQQSPQQMQGQQRQQQQAGQGPQQQQAGQGPQQQTGQQMTTGPQQQQQQQQAGGGQQQQSPSLLQWNLGVLGPNETRIISVSTIPTRIGPAASCMTVSYIPALCTTVNVVQPSLALELFDVKMAAEGISICDTVVFRYVVTNTGTGTADDVVVIHPLPDGLTTIDGKATVTLVMGDLPAGQAKDGSIEVRPTRTGRYTTRAYAKSAADEAYSSPVVTLIQRPELDLQLVGPDTTVFGEDVAYNVTVRNTGDAPAVGTVLQLDTEGIDPADARRDLGTIAPGQARAVSVRVVQTGPDEVAIAAAARSACAEAPAQRAVTRILKLPALLLETVDRVDPVKVGENTVYAISVKNQGNGPATNVTLAGKLPQELQFVQGSGTTAVTAEGQQIQFGAIPSLPPGEVATWYVEAKGAKAGDARFNLELNSDYLKRPILEQEPTRIF